MDGKSISLLVTKEIVTPIILEKSLLRIALQIVRR